MASGDSLFALFPFGNEPPTTNPATPALRNNHPVLEFDTTTAEDAIWTVTLPLNYAGGGITVTVLAMMASATSSTLGWLIAFERMSDATTDLDADSFASAQTITAATVPGTSGVAIALSVAVSNGANMDSIAVGDTFRLKVTRDVTNDAATGDAQLLSVIGKET